MELRHLRYFLAVAEELNFTRAAEKLRLAQPSLTRQIHNLETELGARLLDRSRNQVSLTEDGRRFLVDAKRLVALSLESMESVKKFSKGESTKLNFGYLFKFNFDLLPSTLKALYQACPLTTVNLFDMTPAQQLRALEARKIDLGFVGLRPPASREKSENLIWECVAQHELVVVLPAQHSLAKKAKIEILDLKSAFFVAMSEETHPGSREWLSNICLPAGFTPRILQDVELESGIMTFVAEGLGVTVAREQIKKLPHPGVVFRPLNSPVKAEYWVA
ncbi:MAG: LysR substrate-binding protein, partial [Verrucomicrobiales bacterium]|nr:LysR substrate-binding protein [Verrucomicrobiales bacterium]